MGGTLGLDGEYRQTTQKTTPYFLSLGRAVSAPGYAVHFIPSSDSPRCAVGCCWMFSVSCGFNSQKKNNNLAAGFLKI